MDYQQSELEDLKLKFQESDAARENQRGEIESLKKQGEESNAMECRELFWLFSEHVMELLVFFVLT